MAYDFPNAPVTGSMVTMPDSTVRLYDGVKWIAGATASDIFKYIPQLSPENNAAILNNSTTGKAPVLTGFLNPENSASDFFQIQVRRLNTPNASNNMSDGPAIALRGGSFTTPNAVQIYSGNTAAGYRAWTFDQNGTFTTPGAVTIPAGLSARTATIYNPGQNDPLQITSDNNLYARARFTVSGTRTWSAGCGTDGQFRIGDETAGAFRITVRTDGQVDFANHINVPNAVVCDYASVGSANGIYYRNTGRWFKFGWDAGNGLVQVWVDGGYQHLFASTGWVSANFKNVNAYIPNQNVDYNTSTPTFDSVWASNNIIARNTMFPAYTNTNGEFQLAADGGGRWLRFQSDWRIQWNTGSGDLVFYVWGGSWRWWSTGDGFHVIGNIFAANVSDERVKRDIAPYERGLKELIELQPISYKYNGEGTTVDSDRIMYGLVAQRAKEHIPELVQETEKGPEHTVDKRLPGQLSLDPAPLTYVLINAVKELYQKIQDLTERLTVMEEAYE